MKIVVNPEYEYLREWIERIPSFFEKDGRIIHKARNILKVFSVDNGLDINIKRYKKPHFFNRIVYSFFRKSKAARSYSNTLVILEKGFEAATAIAYIEIKEKGLFSDSYFVSIQCHHVEEIRGYCEGSIAGREELIGAFAKYSAMLHDSGIYHLDYSPGNILFRMENGSYRFYLVDVNRMKFMPVGIDAGCRSFARLSRSDEICRYIGCIYARSRKIPFNEEKAIRLIIKYRNQFFRRKARMNSVKRIFKPKRPIV
ncbi:MAG TPA: hypothetical protein DEQ30_09015 [Porphyromonadaceae bacterium]|nr:hypothetical protein [Porphyromonadaceae bacterium]